MVHVRGIHETGGIEALHVVRAKTQPGTLTTKLARLDHQRGLLERQLAVWTQKQQVTRERLTLVEKQMVEVGRLVRVFAALHRPVRKRAAAAPGQGKVATAASPQKTQMNLEY
jgi:hypothetical protein